MVSAIQEFEEGGAIRLAPQVGHERQPSGTANGSLEVVQDDLTALSIELDRAARRQKWKVRDDLLNDLPPPRVEHRSQPILESKLATVLSNEVDDC